MGRGASNTSVLRRTNAQLVLGMLRDGRAWSGTELQDGTGLSRPTIDAVIDDLVRRRLVHSGVHASAPTGRPARRVRFNPSAGHVAGVDVRRSSIRAVVADLLGAVVAEHTEPSTPTMPRGERLARVTAALEQVAPKAGVDIRDLLAVTVGTPGSVDPATGRVGMCKALSGWSNFPLQDRLSEALGRPLMVENDTNLAAAGEVWRGAAQGCNYVVVLLVGDRPGAGILVNGEPFHGHQGWAGEMFVWELWQKYYSDIDSALVVDLDASMKAMSEAFTNQARNMSAENPPSFTRVSGSPIIDLPAALSGLCQGDTGASQALRKFITGGAWITITITSLLGPNTIVINGIPDPVSSIITSAWQRSLNRHIPNNPTILKVSALGDQAVIVGAVNRALSIGQERILR